MTVKTSQYDFWFPANAPDAALPKPLLLFVSRSRCKQVRVTVDAIRPGNYTPEKRWALKTERTAARRTVRTQNLRSRV